MKNTAKFCVTVNSNYNSRGRHTERDEYHHDDKKDDDDDSDDKATHHHHHHGGKNDDDDASKNGGGSIKISQLQLINIKGDGCGSSAEFLCPDGAPCKGISLSNFHVDGGDMSCDNAFGTATDCDPDSCLKSG